MAPIPSVMFWREDSRAGGGGGCDVGGLALLLLMEMEVSFGGGLGDAACGEFTRVGVAAALPPAVVTAGAESSALPLLSLADPDDDLLVKSLPDPEARAVVSMGSTLLPPPPTSSEWPDSRGIDTEEAGRPVLPSAED